MGKYSIALSDRVSEFRNCSFTSFLELPILFISTSEITSLATSDPSSYSKGILLANLYSLNDAISPPYVIPHSTIVGRLLITQALDEYAVSEGLYTLAESWV